ncbi:MAG: TonB-dependent receptor [Porticoccaceae bacterium]
MSSAYCVVLLALTPAAATAQEAQEQARLEEIVVFGQVQQLRNALDAKRASDIVQDGVSSDAIGQMADQNVTEAARRVTGVSITTDQGEGRFISIRGANPNLNSVSVNGLRVPSASGDERQVAMDVVPSELVSGINITKTNTADMDADAVGGSVEVETFSALDLDDRFISTTIEGNYDDKSKETSPKASMTFMDTLDIGGGRELGVALSANYYKRDYQVDGTEAGDGWETQELGDTEAGVPILVEQRDYTITRERLGLAANFDYRLDSTDLYLRTLYSSFADDEVNPNNIFEGDDGDLEQLSPSNALYSGDFVMEKELGQREETQEIWSIALGGETVNDNWTIDYQAGYSQASEDNPNAMDALFEGEFADDVFVGYSLQGGDIRKPTIASNNMAALNDPANYALSEVGIEASTADDEEWSLELNNTYNFGINDNPTFIKFGGKVRLRDKSQNEDVTIYEGFPGDPMLTSLLADPFDYSLGNFGPQPDEPSIRAFLAENEGDLEVNEEDSDIDSRSADFEMQEDIYAAYIMGKLSFDDFHVIGGVRMERTEFSSVGTELVEDEETETITLLPVEEENTYTDWLPSLSMRYDLNDNLVFHAGYSHTLARPNFSYIAPIAERTVSDDGLEGSFGNPELEPLQSENLDISIEYYPSDTGLLSFAAFAKDIENFVVTANLAGTPGRFVDFEEAIVPVNGETATIRGFELGYQQHLAFLPAPFDGLLVNANYTYTDGEAELELADRTIPLPGQSEDVYNFSLGYEKGNFSARYAVSFRGKYLDELEDPADPTFDRYQDDYMVTDVTAEYQLNDVFKIYGKVQNMDGEPQYFFFEDGSRRNNAQFDDIGTTFTLGVTGRWF